MRTALILIVLALIVFAARIFQNRRNGARLFERLNPVIEVLDADDDGVLSASEIAGAPAALRTLDRNRDGRLTEDELLPSAGRSGRKEPNVDELLNMLMSFDRNGDGKLSRDEVPERMQGLFARGDADHDGILTARESKALAEMSAASAARADFWPNGFMRDDPVVSALDADRDGVISVAEIANASAALKSLDRNGDGKLSLDEMRPAGMGSRRD